MIAAPPLSPAVPVLDVDPFDPEVIENPLPVPRPAAGSRSGGVAVRLMRDILPTREKYSPNVGTWRTRSGHADRVIHGWAYRDLTERDGLRPAINADPAWQRYVADVTPLIADMRSMLLAPLAMDGQASPQ